MKKRLVLFCCIFVVLIASCATTGGSVEGNNGSSKVVGKARSPEMVDHKNQQFGKEIPEWVSMEQYDIEQLPRYKDVYVFKFDSDRSKSLEGAQVWMRNFSMASQISRVISARIKDKAVSAASGNADKLDSYTKELVKIVSEANMSGLKKESDYWTCRRFFTPEGDVEGDFYTVYMIYSVPRKVLDGIIKDAINKANEKEKPKNQEEIDLRDMVNKAMTEDF